MRPRLSAVVIARDEEAVLGRCLASLRGAVDEVVVLDTGSTDHTLPLAWRCGASVYRGEWRDSFADARNEALACARGEWILWIDADEELVAAPEAVRALMDAEGDAYDVEIESLVDDRADGDRFVHSTLRLFRRGEGTRWEGRVHEQVVDLAGPRVRVEGPFLRHHGYRPAIMAAKDKASRTIRLLERSLEECPEEPFASFNLANALLVAGKPEAAYPHAVCATRGMPPGAEYGMLAWHVRLQCAPEPLADADLADAAGWGGPCVEFERAQTLLRRGESEAALAAADRALSLAWPEGAAGDRGVAGHKARLLRAQALLDLGRDAEALAEVELALPADPGYGPTRRLRAEARRRAGLPHAEDLRLAWEAAPDEIGLWAAWTQACEAEGDPAGLVAAYAALAGRQEPSAAVLVNWGRALEDSGQPDRALELFEEAVWRAPDDANACLNCADALGRRAEWSAAAHLYETALRLDAGNAQAWFALGNAYAHAGHADAALRAYDRCLALHPDHAPATHNRAVVAEDLWAA